MDTYSIADAQDGLPQLIDRALEGRKVIISRDRQAAVELRPVTQISIQPSQATYAWLRARRAMRKPIGITSVELLSQIYGETEVQNTGCRPLASHLG